MNNHIYIHSLFPATYRSVGYLPAAAPSPAAPTTKDKSYSAPREKDLSCLDKAHPRPGQGSCSPRLVKLFASPGQLRKTRLLRRSCLIFCSCVICEGEKERREKEEGEARQRSSQADHGVAVAAGRQLLPTGNWLRKRIRKRGGGLPAPPCLAASLPACLPGVRAKTELVFPKWTEAAAPLRRCCLPLLPLCTVTH